MNTGNPIAIMGVFLFLSACGGAPDTAPATEAPSTDNASSVPPTAPGTAATGDQQPCVGADTELTDARRKEYPALVVAAVDGKVKPEEVELNQFVGVDSWNAVFASTPIADPGWFVFESAGDRPQFKDVWGGDADEGDRQMLIEWATGLGAPADFAQCFAETVIG